MDMKKALILSLILLLSFSLFACGVKGNQPQNPGQKEEQQQPAEESDEAAVANLVRSFGSKLQKVSLQAPVDVLKKSMQENYSEFLSPALLEIWQNDPQNAPGRLVSSPWPERIEIQEMKKTSEGIYEVNGEIIEVTSKEKENGGFAAKRPITLVAKKFEKRWLIDSVTPGDYEDADSITYKNTFYGFNFSLPKNWKGYTIVNSQWEGLASGDAQGAAIVETGPMISIRHPQWTADNPRQDIPIMVFTTSQWNSLQENKFHIGAAPIGPKELGSNAKYVFALPARYNFAFPTGYEEVEEILENNPLQPVEYP